MKPILPGSTIGVLGSGQLGRMFAMAARRMGYLVHTFSSETDTPTGQISDREFTASYDDRERVQEFARGVDVVTFEFENVPSSTVEAVAEVVSVRPSGHVLHTTQHRVREKTFLASHGFPVTPFRHVKSIEDFRESLRELGVPAILKTAGFGYDGKGQSMIERIEDAEKAFAAMGQQEAILETFVDFEREVSVIAARGLDGAVANYGVIENTHHRHILDFSLAPAHVSPSVLREATEIAESILVELDVTGVLCVEFFLKSDGKLFVNELAPRPHNSGHLTIDACVTSQFEQQLRAVCGLPLGSTEQFTPSAMANLLGDLWQAGERRKMGHLTARAATTAEALELVRAARESLTSGLRIN
ncbi:MAG: 5-(carboxyamino)imidazole ribonucleotide synthase [Acidobacteria bacterium 13_1_20CM_3_53_8]|nr:MAG: 5-(carboxyamino)imidazole ribonucleotide synthase [Acidobacteria bacterium 13_1_20CM_3_53_8]